MKIAMLLDNPFTNDRRVHREAKELVQAGHSVCIYCVKDASLPSEEMIDGFKVKRVFPDTIAKFSAEKEVRAIALGIAKEDYQVFHCHDQFMCDAGAWIKKHHPERIFVYDSHELFHAWPLNNLKGLPVSILIKSYIVRKYQVLREKRNGRLADYLLTVNQSLSDILFQYFSAKEKPVIIRNAPELEPVLNSVDLKGMFNIPKEEKLLVFIGAHIYARTHNHEQVIDEIGNQKGLHLLYITSFDKGCQDVKDYVASKNYTNIYFHPAVKPVEICSYLSGADVGLVPTWNKNNLSYWYALDNKLFEYTIAEIPVLATQQPEYLIILNQYQNGICVNPDEKGAYLNGLKSILANYASFKEKAIAAKQEINWNAEKKKLVDLYVKIEANIK
ncbi:MAG: glycosyltransferase [Chitinophagales bacterium]|jgi:glycosyltransferase involved in cell wall biosynthesis|nr:glycosyltransferase [Chitinophagales bacterium]